MAPGSSPSRSSHPTLPSPVLTEAHDPPHSSATDTVSPTHLLARRLSTRLFPPQEGISTSTSATPTPPTNNDDSRDEQPAEEEHELVPPLRLERMLTSLSATRAAEELMAENEEAVEDSPDDEFPPQAAIEPPSTSDPSSGSGGSDGTAVSDSAAPPRRRESLSSRVFRRFSTTSRPGEGESELDALGRPRMRRKSLSEKFVEAQQGNQGIPVPSPPSPTSHPVPLAAAERAAGWTHERPESPSPSEAIEPPPARVRSYHPLALEMLVLLMPGSVFGVLARLGLTALDTYDGQGVFALAWVQGVGCLVMGACVGWRDQITAFHPPLYTAIATGFCGSLTTFSSWMLDVFLAFSNGYGYDRIWIYDIMDGLTRTFITFAVSLCGLSLGLHIASYDLTHNHLLRRLGKIHISLPLRLFLVSASLVIYLLCIPMYFVLSPRFRPLATSALLYSFPGTLMRHILGTQLNGRHPYYPLGTFLANALGTAFLAIFHAIQRLPPSSSSAGAGPIGATSCVVLQGLIDGLCGCLSTVSTFAVEVRGMQGRGKAGRRAWMYAVGSWVTGQLLMVAILGGSTWGGGAREGYWCVNRL